MFHKNSLRYFCIYYPPQEEVIENCASVVRYFYPYCPPQEEFLEKTVFALFTSSPLKHRMSLMKIYSDKELLFLPKLETNIYENMKS